MKAIIWGVNGQDGYYLSQLLRAQGLQVIGIGRSGDALRIDITNFEEVEKLVREHQPDYIFHLAANSTTRHAVWKENNDTIGTGSLYILEAVKQFSPHTKVFLSGSGLQFVNTGRPIKETDTFDATSIYAVSRIQSAYTARYYRSLGIKAYVGYFFNHDSPQRGERHINRQVIEAAKRIAAGSTEKFSIGDMTVKKEFGFAGDIVNAVWVLVQQDVVMEAVIGTGQAHTIEEWLDNSFSLQGLHWRDHVVQTEGFAPEYKILVSDPTTIMSLGWKPTIDIRELAKLMTG